MNGTPGSSSVISSASASSCAPLRIDQRRQTATASTLPCERPQGRARRLAIERHDDVALRVDPLPDLRRQPPRHVRRRVGLVEVERVELAALAPHEDVREALGHEQRRSRRAPLEDRVRRARRPVDQEVGGAEQRRDVGAERLGRARERGLEPVDHALPRRQRLAERERPGLVGDDDVRERAADVAGDAVAVAHRVAAPASERRATTSSMTASSIGVETTMRPARREVDAAPERRAVEAAQALAAEVDVAVAAQRRRRAVEVHLDDRADLRHDGVRDAGAEPVGEPRAEPVDPCDLGRREPVERRPAGGERHRVAVERAGVHDRARAAGVVDREHVRAAPDRADGQAAADDLPERRDVGPHVHERLVRAPREAQRDDLVEDEQRADLVGDGARRPEVVGVARDHAARRQHRLEDDRRHVLARPDGGAQALDVVVLVLRDERLDGGRDAGRAGRDGDLLPEAVVATRRLDDPLPSRERAGRADREDDRLAPRVRVADVLDRRHAGAEALGDLRLQLVGGREGRA